MHRECARARSVSPVTFSLTICLALLSGCNNNSNQAVTSSTSSKSMFSVAAISPASGATGVATNTTIQITFSSAANSATVTAANITLTGPTSAAVSGTAAYDSENNTATYTPSAALAASTTYTVKVSGVKSSTGTSLLAAFTSTFTTAAATSSTPTTQYQAPLFSEGLAVINGAITIDTSGSMIVQLTGAMSSTTYSVQFCTAVATGACTNRQTNCFSVGTVSTNADGSGTLTKMFPQSGSWAGDFQLNTGSAKAVYFTSLEPHFNGETYMSTLEPSSTVNGTGLGNTCIAGASTTQAPLTSGTVTFSSGSATYTVTGSFPNMGFTANESENYSVDGLGTYETDTFTTNSNGDATSSSTSFGPRGDLFQVFPSSPGNGVGFIGGFSVPN